MPIECSCAVCGKTIWLVSFDENGAAVWLHYDQPKPYHEPIPPQEVQEQFK